MADPGSGGAAAGGPRRRWPVWLYKAVGAVQVFLVAVMLCVDVALALAHGDGFEELGAALQGLLVGAVLGVVAAVMFVRRPAPAGHGRKLAVLAALLVAWIAGMYVMEIADG